VATLVARLEARGARLYVPRQDWDYAVDAGLRMLTQRHLVDEAGGMFAARATERALLSYYANSIAHLL
jgi:glycerol-3-phosphate O-acyltransferase